MMGGRRKAEGGSRKEEGGRWKAEGGRRRRGQRSAVGATEMALVGVRAVVGRCGRRRTVADAADAALERLSPPELRQLRRVVLVVHKKLRGGRTHSPILTQECNTEGHRRMRLPARGECPFACDGACDGACECTFACECMWT